MQVSDSSIFRAYLEQTPRSRELFESPVLTCRAAALG